MSNYAPRTAAILARDAGLEAAVCTCGHYFDDHRCAGWDIKTGRIDLAECKDTTCPCARYDPDRCPCAQCRHS